MPHSHQVFVYFVQVVENKFVGMWVVFKWTLLIWCDEQLTFDVVVDFVWRESRVRRHMFVVLFKIATVANVCILLYYIHVLPCNLSPCSP